jgi:hypothetical protein
VDEKHDKPELVQRLILTGGAKQSPCDGWLRQVMNVSVPADVRVEAVLKLAEHCRTHNIFQVIHSIVDHESDSVAVRAAIVRAMPAWDEASHPTMMLPTMVIVGALSVPGVRAAAMETLERMGAARGEKEARLLRHLASLRPGESGLRTMGTLGKLYGRDYRVQNLLRETMRAGNRWERALAASELFGLGEVDTALDAAADPEPRVRKSLAAAIGRYHESRGAEVLGRLVHDPDPEVAHQARESLGGDTSATPAFSWRRLLEELSEFRLTDPLIKARLPQDKVASGWLGGPGAGEEQVRTLERRLGRSLPPSYRAFLLASNGFHLASFIQRLYRADEVDWFRVHNADWAKAFQDTYPGLGDCLQVSAIGDAAVVLLNPKVVSADGEWQTYFFANWIPGARPYRSFADFVSDEIDGVCEWRNR